MHSLGWNTASKCKYYWLKKKMNKWNKELYLFNFVFATWLSLCVGQFLFLLMIYEDEDDNSCYHSASIWSETDVPGTYSTNHGVNQVRQLCTSVVLVDIVHFQKSVKKHPHCRIRKWMNLGFFQPPIGSTAHPPWVGVGPSRKSRYASTGTRTQASQLVVSDANH
jgi:hypothetical protein